VQFALLKLKTTDIASNENTASGQLAQLSQRDRAAGCVSFGQKCKTRTGRQYFTHIIGLSSTTVITFI